MWGELGAALYSQCRVLAQFESDFAGNLMALWADHLTRKSGSGFHVVEIAQVVIDANIIEQFA